MLRGASEKVKNTPGSIKGFGAFVVFVLFETNYTSVSDQEMYNKLKKSEKFPLSKSKASNPF